MNVTYLVAGNGAKPNGGTRIIYEQANRLALRGHRVGLDHFIYFPSDRWRGIPRRWWQHTRWTQSGQKLDWFDFAPGVHVRYFFRAKLPQYGPDEKIIATYWKTHDLLDRGTLANWKCFYLIQGLETQYVSERRLAEHWRSPSRNFAISEWLCDHVREVASQCEFVPNAIDPDFFTSRKVTKDRSIPVVLFPALQDPWKGSRVVVKALELLVGRGCQMRVKSFGNVDLSGEASFPIQHFPNPTQILLRDLYQEADVFVNASWREGWGLTVAEAASCGAALVVSNNAGHREIVEHDRSTLLFEPTDHLQLADYLQRVVEDESLRQRLAAEGRAAVSRFNWDATIDRLERLLRT